MKSINILIISITLSFIAKSQDYKDLGTYPAPKYLSQAHDISISSDQIILSYSPYLNTLNVAFSFYKYAALKSGLAFTDKKIKPNEGVIRECYYSGDTITEFVVYLAKGFPNSQHTFVLRNRSARTMEVLGKEKTLATHSFGTNMPDFMRVRLVEMPDGFAFVELIKDVCTISYLSKDFEELKKVVVSDQNIAMLSCKECYNLKSHDDGSLTFFFPQEKIIKVLQVTDDGEPTWFEPIDLSPKTNVWRLIGDFAYDKKKKELSWVFLAKSDSDDHGYGIVKWNEAGQIITNEVKILQDEDIYQLDTDAKKYFVEERKKPTRDIWNEARELFPYVGLMNVGDVNYAMVYLTGAYKSFSLCYLIKLDESGGSEWIKPIVSEVGTIRSILPYENNGKLNLFIADFTANSKNDVHFVSFSRKAEKSYSFYNLVIDPVDGKEISNEKYDADTGSESQLINVQLSEKERFVLIEFLKGKQVMYRQIKW